VLRLRGWGWGGLHAVGRLRLRGWAPAPGPRALRRWQMGRAEAVPAHLAVSCLGQHYGLNWWPRHGTVYGLCPARAVPGPCFLVPCPGRPTVLVPFDHLYSYTVLFLPFFQSNRFILNVMYCMYSVTDALYCELKRMVQ
jgi:hypothetical protein